MPTPDLARLRHIWDAAAEALALAQGRIRADLDRNRLLNLALVRLLEIIGEAANGLSPELRAAHPQVPWHRMIGMRNRLVHAYFDINLDIVWETVQQDLPPLMGALDQIIRQEEACCPRTTSLDNRR